MTYKVDGTISGRQVRRISKDPAASRWIRAAMCPWGISPTLLHDAENLEASAGHEEDVS